MTSAKDIQELVNFNAGPQHVVSLYLEIDPQGSYWRRSQSLVQEALAGDPALKALGEDFELAARHIAQFQPQGRRGLAVFSSRRSGFWQAVPLPQSVPDSLRVGETPYLAPLNNILDQHHRYGVALIAPDQARFMEVCLGQIEEHPFGPPPGRRNCGSIADLLHRHLKAVADGLIALARTRGLERVILGAPQALEPLLMHHLHSRLQDSLIIDSQLEIGMALPEVLERVLTGERESRKVLESVLVYRLLDAAKAEGMGVVGMAQTLRALHLGQVRMLLVREGLAKMGRVCPHCGAIALNGKKCIYCWLDTEPVVNVVGSMVQTALDQGCQVYQIMHNRRLDSFGGVGAELRFKDEIPQSQPEVLKESLALTGAPPAKGA